MNAVLYCANVGYSAAPKVLGGATPKAYLVEHTFVYPPDPFHGVPDENDDPAIVLEYCKINFPELANILSIKSARLLVYLHGIANRPELWPAQFLNLAEHLDA